MFVLNSNPYVSFETNSWDYIYSSLDSRQITKAGNKNTYLTLIIASVNITSSLFRRKNQRMCPRNKFQKPTHFLHLQVNYLELELEMSTSSTRLRHC